jgi:hypothetical protein
LIIFSKSRSFPGKGRERFSRGRRERSLRKGREGGERKLGEGKGRRTEKTSGTFPFRSLLQRTYLEYLNDTNNAEY